MPKQPVSVTLERENLLWLRGRVAGGQRRSLSDALDDLIRQARQVGLAAGEGRSVVGTIDIAPDDPGLDRADAHLQAQFEASLNRPMLVREDRSTHRPTRGGRGRARG